MRRDSVSVPSSRCWHDWEALQWLDSGWELPTGKEQGWPRRRYYQLSKDGLALARGALASARAAPAPAMGRLRQVGETA